MRCRNLKRFLSYTLVPSWLPRDSKDFYGLMVCLLNTMLIKSQLEKMFFNVADPFQYNCRCGVVFLNSLCTFYNIRCVLRSFAYWRDRVIFICAITAMASHELMSSDIFVLKSSLIPFFRVKLVTTNSLVLMGSLFFLEIHRKPCEALFVMMPSYFRPDFKWHRHDCLDSSVHSPRPTFTWFWQNSS